LRNLASEALETYRTGSWSEIAVFRLRETQLLIAPLLLLSLPRTLGLMLWGIAAWRSGFLEGRQHARRWRYVAVLGVVCGVIGIVTHRDEVATISLAFSYAAAILLWNPRWFWLAAGGRMALTNYLLQSFAFSMVFYAYGLGWFGSVGVGAAMLGGLILYAIQLAGSRWWLTRFRFGPAEWLWRSMTYRRWQPFLLENGWMVSRAALRFLMVVTFVFVIPVVHLGTPLLLSQAGPRWGWHHGQPGIVNLSGGALLIAAGFALLGWILTTMLAAATRSMPAQVRLGLRPALLVQSGPYMYMRHPMYVAETCFWAGAGILLGSPVVIGLYLCLGSAGFNWIIRREEKALEEQFGEEYRDYRRRVPVLPWLRS
jgi:protein-S-isoprenylcysteine O-methyltransferase Ste14